MALISRDFIFIHIYKTGGNSVRQMLPTGTEMHGVHCNADDVKLTLEKKGLVEMWETKYKFAFVRNPYDWMVSLFYYIHNAKNHGEHKHTEKGFEHFLNHLTKNLMLQERAVGQNKYMTASGFCGKDLDFIGRYENLVRDMQHVVMQELRVKSPNKHVNKTAHRPADWRDMYNKRCYKIVNKHFEEDFIRFGYDMTE